MQWKRSGGLERRPDLVMVGGGVKLEDAGLLIFRLGEGEVGGEVVGEFR